MKYSEADHFREIAGINVPDNIAVFLNRFHSAIEISISNTDVENGYGQRIEKRLVIKMPYERCVNCGYHSLWNPNDTESKCRRHTYAKGWDTVFCYNPATDGNLEQSFQNWLEDNENKVMIGERKSIWLKSGIPCMNGFKLERAGQPNRTKVLSSMYTHKGGSTELSISCQQGT